jgi:hypothetical protein
MDLADVSGDGGIDYNEFVAATLHVSKLEKEENLVRVRAARAAHAWCLRRSGWPSRGR